MKPSVTDGIRVSFALVAALLIVNALLGYKNVARVHDDSNRVAHTLDVPGLSGDVLVLLVDAETGQRGYLATGESEFLEPYHEALGLIDNRIAELKRATSDNMSQQDRIKTLEQRVGQKRDLLKRGIELRNANAGERELLAVARDGKKEMDAIRRLIADMKGEEYRLLDEHKHATRKAFQVAVGTSLLGTIVGLTLVSACVALVSRNTAVRKKSHALLQEQREWFRMTLASIGDGVIATDTVGCVSFMNPMAEKLTGWNEEEARGKSLDIVFHIVNEATRQTAENPALRALNEGVIVELANHTILIDRDGVQWPLDDSAAPVIDDQGRIQGCVLVFREITSRKRAEEQLRESERQFRLLADSIPQLAWMTGPEGNIIWFNKRWYEYTGTTPAQSEGWGSPSVHDPSELPRVLNGWNCALASGTPWEDTFALRRHDGQMRWHLSRAFPVRDDEGRIVRWFGTNTDITDRMQIEQELKAADFRKDQFLATLAHELRNPLAPLRNALQIMRLAGHDLRKLESVREMMQRQLNHMVRLIDDLMDLSRVSRNRLHLQKKPTELAAVIESAIETSQPLVEQSEHSLIVTMPSEPIVLDADFTRLAQVFSNLLNNAVKYTERGGRIHITVHREGTDAVVSVRDNGIVIPADQLSQVFEMFSQVDQSLERTRGGLGIGLTLVRRLTELHGGSVVAYSEGPGKGSEFITRLPVVQGPIAPVPSRPPDESSPRPGESVVSRILIVDDNEDAAASLAMVLRTLGFEIRIASDGLDALEEAQSFLPQVVLLDIGLPKMNGYVVARRIREQPWGKRMVLIATTGWGQEEDFRRSREAGFDQHMVKPLDPIALERLLASLQPSFA